MDNGLQLCDRDVAVNRVALLAGDYQSCLAQSVQCVRRCVGESESDIGLAAEYELRFIDARAVPGFDARDERGDRRIEVRRLHLLLRAHQRRLRRLHDWDGHRTAASSR